MSKCKLMKKFFFSISLLILMLPAVSCQKDSYGVDGTTPLPEAVDLGLPSGIKWASFNLGAAKEYEYGDYYAWAETEAYYTSLKPLTWKSGKENGYNWPSYSWCNGSFMKLTKYCPKNQTGSWDVPQTEPDGLVELQPSDDVAHVKLGGKWRIPTLGEIDELLSLQTNNDYIWLQGAVATDENGKEVKDLWGNVVQGVRITRKSTGATLFLPAAGSFTDKDFEDAGSWGFYWSFSLMKEKFPECAYNLLISPEQSENNDSRSCGFSVRAVCD